MIYISVRYRLGLRPNASCLPLSPPHPDLATYSRSYPKHGEEVKDHGRDIDPVVTSV